MVHLINIVITFLRIRAISFLINVVSDLKFGHFYFSWPHLTSATLEVRWKTSIIVDVDVEKRELNSDSKIFLPDS